MSKYYSIARSILNHTSQLSQDTGVMALGMAINSVLHVSPNGNDLDGSSWDKAFNNPVEAFNAASVDPDDLTLILTSPHDTYYDIDITGDPTWTGNYIIAGSHRTWAKFMNTHVGATSIMKFTGKVGLLNLNYNLGSGSVNGVILTHGGFRAKKIQFVGQDLTGAATALHIDGSTILKHGKIADVHFLGHTTHMKGLLFNKVTRSVVKNCQMHECLTGLHITDVDSDQNSFDILDIGDCALGVDLDAGNGQHFHHIDFHGNTRNIDDEVGDHHYQLIQGHFPLTLLPDNFTGVTLPAGVGADTWGADTEILSAASRDNPFRVIGFAVEADANEKFRIRLSSDSGATHFADLPVEGQVAEVQRQSIALPAGTEAIFNKGTRISGSCKSETGSNNAVTWLQIQEI